MEQKSNDNHLFLIVVDNMKDTGYLLEREAAKLKSSYERYIDDIRRNNEEKINRPTAPQWDYKEKMVESTADKIDENLNMTPELKASLVTISEYTGYKPIENNNKSDLRPINIQNNFVKKSEPVTTRVMTKEEIRDRNLSWILNIGVVLILLSGVIFGTSTWGFMNNISKAILLCSVSILFFVISIIAKVVVKIEKSSNAFWIMGSLLFPVSLLSIGYFQLLGKYLSIMGEGKYLFGIVCTFLCLPIYIWSTYRNKSRTFAWIALIDVSLLFTFFALSLNSSVGILMFLLFGFNCLLIVTNIFAKKVDSISIFMNEIPLFLQFNLILTTAISLLAYDNSYLYSVNIVLAAMLFFAISLSQKKEGYDFVFGLLFTGGMFMLSREFHSQSATFIISAVVGYVFTGIASLINKDVSKGFRYQIFSGVTALIAFFYVAGGLISAHTLHDSVIGVVALCIITINYLYLSYKTSSKFFGVIVPIQAVVIFYELANLFRYYFHFNYSSEFVLLMTIFLFVFGYMFNNLPKFITVRKSSLVVSLINTCLIFILCIFIKPLFISLPIVGFVFVAELFVVSRNIKNEYSKMGLDYIISFLFFISLCLIQYSYISGNILSSVFKYYGILPYTFYFICALITFLLHFVAVKKLSDFKKPLFFSGHILMILIYLNIIYMVFNTNSLSYSVVGLIAIFIITINHIYLFYKKSDSFLGILVPIQAIIIFYEIAFLFKTFCHFKYFSEYLLLLTMALFVVGYMFNVNPRFKYIKFSSLVMALLNTLAIFGICSYEKSLLLSLPIISFVFTAELLVVSRKTIDEASRKMLNYVVSFLLFASLCLIQNAYSLSSIPSNAFYFFCALATFMIHFVAVKKLVDLRKPLFYCGHFLMACIFILILMVNKNDFIYTIPYFLLGLAYLYSILITKNKIEKDLWFYAGLVSFTLLVSRILSQINFFYAVDLTKYSIYICGFLMIGLYFLLKNIELKKHNVIYLFVITAVMIAGNLFITKMLWYEYIAEIAFASLLCICMFGSELDIFAFLPLSLFFTSNHILSNIILKGNFATFPILVIWFIVLLIIGSKKYQFIFDLKNKSIDWFSIFAFISIFNVQRSYANFDVLWLTSMLPGIMGTIWFYLNRKWLGEVDENRFGSLLFALSLLWPYYSLLVAIYSKITNNIYELVLLPLVLLTYICIKWIYRGIKNSSFNVIEYTIPSIAYIILLVRLFYSHDLSHSLILGAVGLISVLYATVFKTRSALILGGALILTSVFIQTRTFWISIEWWIYLLVLGSVLIIVASFNEFQKNKYNEDVLTKTGKFLDKFSDWE